MVQWRGGGCSTWRSLARALASHRSSIIDRHGYDCKYDAFIARPVSNRPCLSGESVHAQPVCDHGVDIHRRTRAVLRRESDSNFCRDSKFVSSVGKPPINHLLRESISTGEKLHCTRHNSMKISSRSPSVVNFRRGSRISGRHLSSGV